MTGYTNLYLYKNTKFYKHQNYKIDDINSFLATLQLDKLTFEELQYFRPDTITKEIKIAFNQKGIKALHQYNYARIEIYNTDGTKEWELFYFVDRVEWLSMDCIKLHMTLDTLNSFLDLLEFHPRTFIEREHTDRWDYRALINDTTNKTIQILRAIPELNEGLNPQKYTFGLLNANAFAFEFTSTEQSYYVYPNSNTNDFGWICAYVGLNNDENEIYSYTILMPFANANDRFMWMNKGSDSFTASHFEDLILTSQTFQSIMLLPYAPSEDLINWEQYTSSNPYIDTIGVAHADKIKYIEDTLQSKTINGVVIENRYKFNSRLYNDVLISIDLVSPNSQYYEFKQIIYSIYTEKFSYDGLTSSIKNNGYFKDNSLLLQHYSNESALFSSEFLQLSFSFGDNDYIIGLEDFYFNGKKTLAQILSTSYGNGIINIFYNVSLFNDKNIYFKFKNGEGFNISQKVHNGHIMIVPINSQIPLITSEYLNYLRNGYNYDIKIRDTNRDLRKVEQEQRQWEIGRSMLSLNPFKVIRGMGTLIADYSTIGDNGGGYEYQKEALTRMQEDLQMEKQQVQMKGSKLGVEQVNGGLDKTLQFSKNALGFNIMLSKKSWWKYLEDYFYYFGNKVQYYGIPTHNNRCLFDYLKCRAEFVNRNSIPNNEALQDIISRLNNGITFIHKYLNQYTFDSDYKENVENRLLEIIQGE